MVISLMHFELLCVTENDQRNDVDIIDHLLLQGYLLDPRGYENGILNVCHGCESRLQVGHLPMYALHNNMYRGTLPEHF